MKNLDKVAMYADCTDDHIQLLDITNYDKDKPTLLIIDDYDSVIVLFKRLVKRLKLEDVFNVIYGTGNDVALRVLKTIYCKHSYGIKIDLVLSDITFGGAIMVKDKLCNFNGVELIGVLKEVYPDIRYEFISGHTVEEDIRPELFEEFKTYNKNFPLTDYVSYKDKPISTDKTLILKLLKGTIYENLINN